MDDWLTEAAQAAAAANGDYRPHTPYNSLTTNCWLAGITGDNVNQDATDQTDVSCETTTHTG